MGLYWDKLLNPTRARIESSVQKLESDNRSPYKKDFDTVCNSAVLRRLQDKAQVFPLEQEDYARTRLTHSIEVLSIAGSLAVQAVSIIKKTLDEYVSDSSEKTIEKTREYIEEIPTILNTAALLHDMGNPPFGHLGEQIISDWFSENLSKIVRNGNDGYSFNDVGEAKNTLAYILKGKYADDLTHFDGNAQLLRLVTKLNYVVDKNGMNLSYPVIATFIKYPCASSKIDDAKLSTKKAGYFSAEEETYKKISETLGLIGCRHPLAFLLEAADDIAYLTADIEDAHHKGIVTVSCLKEYLKSNQEDAIVKRVLDEMDAYEVAAKNENYPNIENYIIHRIRVMIKGLMIDAMYESFENNYEAIMKGSFESELIAESSVAILASVLRRIEKEKIYYCNDIVVNKTRAIKILYKLLDTYVPAILSYNSDDSKKDNNSNLLYLSLSENYRFVCEQANMKPDISEAERVYNLLLLITDQISGMTDSRAMTVHKMITAR